MGRHHRGAAGVWLLALLLPLAAGQKCSVSYGKGSKPLLFGGLSEAGRCQAGCTPRDSFWCVFCVLQHHALSWALHCAHAPPATTALPWAAAFPQRARQPAAGMGCRTSGKCITAACGARRCVSPGRTWLKLLLSR